MLSRFPESGFWKNSVKMLAKSLFLILPDAQRRIMPSGILYRDRSFCESLSREIIFHSVAPSKDLVTFDYNIRFIAKVTI